jgi:Asp-tRNA(Asn)/Glu-tRNA(Gln) amidotransferase A subunit family amidase
MRRRDAVKKIIAGAVGGAAVAGADAQGQQAPAPGVTADEVGTVNRVSGRSYSEEERRQVAGRVTRYRTLATTLREVTPAETIEPATHFDPRVPGTLLPTGKSRFQLSKGKPPEYDRNPDTLAFLSAVELGRLIRAGTVTSVAVTRMYLDRLRRFAPRLNCVVTLTEALALRQAERADQELAAGKVRGPLHGVPWGAKDLLATRGIRTTWGARPYENQVFNYDAAVVQRLDAAGAVLVAKLTSGELALGDVWFGGRTRNPWDSNQGSSGSSAGPGSATAAGLVGFSIGSETHGSIVSPCVRNGVTGLRPTYGRVPRTGAMALCWTLDKLGPMCRGVEDCAAVLAAIHGPDGQDASVADVPFQWDPSSPLARLRVGVASEAFESVQNPALKKVYQEALNTLRSLGVELRPVALPKSPAFDAVINVVLDVEAAASFMQLTESERVRLLARQENWPATFRGATAISAVDYLQAMRVRRQLQVAMAHLFHDLDLYVTVPFEGPTMAYTNATGNPSLTTRCGMHEGRPVTIEFIGALYREDAILRLGHAYERATGWWKHHPDLSRLPALPPDETYPIPGLA